MKSHKQLKKHKKAKQIKNEATMRKEENMAERRKEYQCCPLFVLRSAVLLPKVEQSCCLSASTSFCFSLPLPLLVLLSPLCPYSFHLSCFFTHHLNSVIPSFPLSAISPPHSSSYLYFYPPFFFCLPLCYFLGLSLPLSNAVFNSLNSAFCSVSIFPLPLSIISLPVSPFTPYCSILGPSSPLHYSDVHLSFLSLPSPA